MIKRWFSLLCCACVVAACATTQKVETPRPQAVPKPETLPIDPAVRSGKLANGLRYVIRENKRPENRAELRLVVDAGSILEDADQQGLAHFVEHMAFNGTANFPKQDIVNFLEGIGMRFGPDLNAYTSFDETVYMLQVPTDSAAVMEKAFRILGDWAHRIKFDPEEIEKERGVVIEEWRSGRGAGARMRDAQLPVLLKDSRYAERLPIGQKALLDTFKHASLTRYYRDWYRPDLMGVIAVGDFSADAIEALIKKTFAPIPKAENPRVRTAYTVPDHTETLFAIATDPENSRSSVSVYFLREVAPEGTVENYRSMLIRSMFNSMLNQRFDEMIKKPDPPFLGAGSSHGNLVRTKAAYILGAGVKEGGIERGLEAILTEALRVQRHGFTQSEVDRLKTNMLRSIEQAYRERDKRRSGGFASEYIRHFLTDEPIPGIEIERALFQKLLPGIQAEEINRLVGEWLTAENRVIVVSAPEKAGLPVPSEAELLGILNTETWRDTGIRPPKGVIEKTIRRGREPKSRTRLIFTGPFDWDDRFGRYAFDSMGDVLNIKLREVLREDEGGTYGVGVRTSVSRWPEGKYSISISFGCAPVRLEELTQLVFVQIDSMKQKPVDQSYIDKVTEMDLRRRETNLKENRYWRNTLQWYYQHDKDMMALLAYEAEIVKKLTAEDVQQAAQQYFNMKNYGRFVLLPEGETKKSKATTDEKRIAD